LEELAFGSNLQLKSASIAQVKQLMNQQGILTDDNE